MIVGIVCEYNPFHLGHRKQLDLIRAKFGPDTAIVCTMSGNFVQRGMPAIADKSIRAEAAVRCGADLVVELPVTAALSSAEGFAAGGVEILSRVCDVLCFGCETGDSGSLMATAAALLSQDFSTLLHQELDRGLSFPAARERALGQMGLDPQILARPNDILAVEYCKAVLTQKSKMDIFPIRREGSYHAERADPENPSATSLRLRMEAGEDWEAFVPAQAADCFRGAALHTLEAGEAAILYKLRTMTEAEFERVPFGSEGLWRKLMHASRREASLEDIFTAVKSKRYTRTRLNRMVMCAFLGITQEDMAAPLPWARVLAFHDRGREILRSQKESGFFPNAGQALDHPYWELEKRCGSLYGLFCADGPEPPKAEETRRVRYMR